jgi:ABC-type transport system involved in cytochrome c biogenesis ATPase subunit
MNQPPSPPSVELQQKPGGTISHHRARSFSRRDADDSATLLFNGVQIIDAVFDVLENASALRNYSGVVLAGSSAGAVGAAIHAPRLQARIDASAIASTPTSNSSPAPQVHILADSGWFVELPPTPGDLVSRTHSSLDRIRAATPFWNSSAALLPACGQTSSLSECYRLEHLSTRQTLPAFYLNSVQDLVLLDELVDPKGASLPELASFLHSWAGSLRYSFTRASQAWAEREDSVADRNIIFVPACLQHAFFSATGEDLALSRESYDGQEPLNPLRSGLRVYPTGAVSTPGLTLVEALEAWLASTSVNGTALPETLYMDGCLALQCNPTCPVDATSLPALANTLDQSSTRAVLICVAILLIASAAIVSILTSMGYHNWRRQGVVLQQYHTQQVKIVGSEDSISTAMDEEARFEGKGLTTLPKVAIRARQLSYWPDHKSARRGQEGAILHSVMLSLQPGSVTAIMGPSGSGKTTILDVLSGRRHFGVVAGAINAVGLSDDVTLSDAVSYVENSDVFIELLTMREALRHHLFLTQPDLESHGRRFWDVVRMLRLEEALDTKLSVCSSGQRRRASVAMAIMQEKPVLFLDEPTSGT